MKSNAKIVEELKKLTLEKELDFSIAVNYFLDNVAENENFIKSSKPFRKKKEFYKSLLMPAVEKLFGVGTSINDLRLVQVKKLNFIHGPAMLSNGIFVTLYFFEDVEMGMAIISVIGDKTHFFRLSVSRAPPYLTSSMIH